MQGSLGILITNTVTPDSPSVPDVKRYLKSFLSDPKVVRLPKFIWRPLLNYIILPRRSPYSASLYQKIWTQRGSPLRYIMQDLAAKLEQHINEDGIHVFVEVGMHYGNPSIQSAIEKLVSKGITELLVLPLYPQYSTSTTESGYKITKEALQSFKSLPAKFAGSYAQHPAYIDAIAKQIALQHDPNNFLLFSFHGLPQKFVDKGDPYADECMQTAELVAKQLNLSKASWGLSYQSRFGFSKWLEPNLEDVLKELPNRGIYNLTIVCPGFSIDCLETLEEVKLRAKELFFASGGKSFQYIDSLNATQLHINALKKILLQ
ncbi:MAG TPA: ferrochelatase [Gammaproteobacteria bacterium]|nr:ferrochelatase [Gammaproteobacteria bacterium]